MQGKALKIVYERFYERFNWRIRIQLEDWFSKKAPSAFDLLVGRAGIEPATT